MARTAPTALLRQPPKEPIRAPPSRSRASTLLSGGTSGEFDADKVARMSQAIASGTFKVNPGAIADKLIANAQELLSKVQS